MSDSLVPMVSVAALDRELLGGVQIDPEMPTERRQLDVGVLPYFEDERPLQGLAGFLDWRTGGHLSTLLREGFCSGKAGEAVLFPATRPLPAERWVLVGLGPSAGFDRRASEAAAHIVTIVTRLQPRDVLLSMPGRVLERTAVEEVFRGLTARLAATMHTTSHLSAIDGDRDLAPPFPPPPPPTPHWWVVAEARHVARLRRLLEGPPRAAGE